ncbi:MAG: hypothetical protein JXJ04_23195 [Spirochaetales bacterium]|nr:hypothetical protein [Spirochaetales bacterium]
MRHFLKEILQNIMSGYLRSFKVLGFFLLRIFILVLFSFLIVFPQWYFAIHYKLGYNIVILFFFSCFIIYVIGVKIFRYIKTEGKKSVGLPVIFRFTILISELYLIRYFLLSNHIFFIIPGILLSCEFLFFLCLIKGKKAIILPWMHTLLIVIASFEILYSSLVFFARGDYIYTSILLSFFILSIGYLLYKSGNSGLTNQKKQKYGQIPGS